MAAELGAVMLDGFPAPTPGASLGGTGIGTPGGSVVTLNSAGATRNTLDDGSGNMIASAALNVLGNLTATSLLNVNGGLRLAQILVTAAGTTTVAITNAVVLCDCTAGSQTINLEAAPTSLITHYIKRIDATANTVTLSGNGNTIDGSATIALASNESVLVAWNATNAKWYVIAANAGAIV